MPQVQILLVFDGEFDPVLIRLFISLSARAVHRWPFAHIQHAELDTAGIDGSAHQAAHGVDLTDDVPFGNAADGRIAAHLANGVQIRGQQRRVRAHAGRSGSSFSTGVSGTDHQHVIVVFDSFSHRFSKG